MLPLNFIESVDSHTLTSVYAMRLLSYDKVQYLIHENNYTIDLLDNEHVMPMRQSVNVEMELCDTKNYEYLKIYLSRLFHTFTHNKKAYYIKSLIAWKKLDILKMLSDKCIDMNKMNRNGRLITMIISSGSEEMLEWFISKYRLDICITIIPLIINRLEYIENSHQILRWLVKKYPTYSTNIKQYNAEIKKNCIGSTNTLLAKIKNKQNKKQLVDVIMQLFNVDVATHVGNNHSMNMQDIWNAL